jgi:hypothetical protein
LENACCRSGKVILTSCLLPENVRLKMYKTVMLPAVFYGREAWCLPLREEYRLGVFGNRVLRRIFGPKREELAASWGIA